MRNFMGFFSVSLGNGIGGIYLISLHVCVQDLIEKSVLRIFLMFRGVEVRGVQ